MFWNVLKLHSLTLKDAYIPIPLDESSMPITALLIRALFWLLMLRLLELKLSELNGERVFCMSCHLNRPELRYSQKCSMKYWRRLDRQGSAYAFASYTSLDCFWSWGPDIYIQFNKIPVPRFCCTGTVLEHCSQCIQLYDCTHVCKTPCICGLCIALSSFISIEWFSRTLSDSASTSRTKWSYALHLQILLRILCASNRGWTTCINPKFPDFYKHRDEFPLTPDGTSPLNGHNVITPSSRKAVREDLHSAIYELRWNYLPGLLFGGLT